MGSGVWPLAMATRPASSCHVNGGGSVWKAACGLGLAAARGGVVLVSSAHRAISTGQLRGLPRFHLRPIDVVVFHGSRRDLVLRRVSRLDAFSGYPVRT